MPPSVSPSHLPGLPTETYALILTFCDQDTLTRASLVSLAFLELAGPLLYRHIAVTGYKQVDRLFYSETRTSTAPHLDPFLSLDQTRTFAFTGTPKDQGHLPPSGVPGRASATRPLRIDTLTAHLHNPVLTRASHNVYDPKLARNLLALFSPTHVELSSYSVPNNQDHVWIDFSTAEWTSLESLSVLEIPWNQHLSRASFLSKLAPGSLTVTYNLTRPLDPWEMLQDLVYDLGGDEQDREDEELLNPKWPQVKEVVIRVRTDDQRKYVQRAVRGGWDEREWTQEERARREDKIRYIVARQV